MAATFTWQGATHSGTVFDIGPSGSSVNFTQNSDWAVARADSPIPAGQPSIERNVRGCFSGAFTAISNVKFWRSDLNVLSTGVSITCGGLADGNGLAFGVPSVVANADAAIPTSKLATNAVVNVTAGVEADGKAYAPRLFSGLNRWLRLQVKTTGATPAGDIAPTVPHFQVTMEYTEN